MGKYSLDGLDTIHKLRNYMLKALHEMKCGECEIEEYLKNLRKKDFYEMLALSQEYIDMLNNMVEV